MPPLYTLPFPITAIRQTALSQRPPPSPRKRKRSSLSDEESTNEDEAQEDDSEKARSDVAATLLAGLTNPLSLAPDEVRQYRAAGLSLDQPLPSTSTPDFPHRALPTTPLFAPESQGADQVDRKRVTHNTGSHLRVQHLGVLTTVLHRCLLDGDVARASRAWAMLLRSELNGKPLDVRSSGYWGIGAELLIRSSQWDSQIQSTTQNQQRDPGAFYSSQQTAITASQEQGETTMNTTPRWGTKTGLDLAKEYFERLILQYPYRQRFDASVNALDFWPAMLACEIYGIQYDETTARQRLEHLADDSEYEASSNESGQEDYHATEQDFAALERRATQRRERRAEKVFLQLEEVRMAALQATEGVAGRMDELMTKPPFSDSRILLRLRGMLAVYVGDLSVPGLGPSTDADLEDDNMQNRDSSHRIVAHQRKAEHTRGLGKKQEEYRVAMEMFRKMSKDAGDVDKGVEFLQSHIAQTLKDEDEIEEDS